MLEILRDHPATVNELAAAVPVARPGVSRHLRVLREAGLVDVEVQAQWRIYRLRPAPLAESTTGWPTTGCSGSSGWTPCTPRSPVANVPANKPITRRRNHA